MFFNSQNYKIMYKIVALSKETGRRIVSAATRSYDEVLLWLSCFQEIGFECFDVSITKDE